MVSLSHLKLSKRPPNNVDFLNDFFLILYLWETGIKIFEILFLPYCKISACSVRTAALAVVSGENRSRARTPYSVTGVLACRT